MEKEKKSNKKIVVALSIIIVLLLGAIIALSCDIFDKKNDNKDNKNTKTNTVEKQAVNTEYKMEGNGLEKIDLAFLKLENNGKNAVYSPLSIKYALEMLAEGANGNTKAQLDGIIGKYETRKYENSKNMSFANALFVKDSFKDVIKDTYQSKLKNKYNADVVFDSFEKSDNLNKWVSDKTLGLIDNLFDDISDLDYILVNALGIDMEWVHKIQGLNGFDEGYRGYNYPDSSLGYNVDFEHENFSVSVMPLTATCYTEIKFNTTDSKEKVTNEKVWENEDGYQAVHFEAVANKYDIVKEVGLENMKKTVTDAYKKYIAEGYDYSFLPKTDEELAKEVDKYVEDINKHYNFIGSSTDFRFYDDENVKVFAKDLKEYNGITLEYIGIMPKVDTLKEYIDKVDVATLNNIISNLKDITMDNFEDGYITRVFGYIPLFKIDNELDLIKDLRTLGVTDVFDEEKADLSNISDVGSRIVEAKHDANIEFTNDGIKASAAVKVGGLGDVTFDIYKYDVPTKTINLTFDNPFLYLVRNKNTGEVWFVGTVYEPNKYTNCGWY